MEYTFALLPNGPARGTVELVKQAEELGYTTAWIPDQEFYRDPFVLMNACAAATSRIKIGVCVTNPYTRLPVQIARAVAAVDELSNGRAILVLGAANRKHVLTPLGIDLSKVAQRIREAVLVIRRLFAGEAVTYTSSTLYMDGVKLSFQARPDIPIWIGTKGPLVLQAAGEVADGVVIEGHFTRSGMDYALSHVARGAEKTGRSVEALPVTAWQVVRIVDDPAPVLESMRNWVSHLMSTSPAASLVQVGFDAEMVARTHADYKAGGPELAGRNVSHDDVRRMAIVGRPDEVAAAVQVLEDRGVNAIAVLMLGSYDEIAIHQRRFMEEVVSKAPRHVIGYT
jgi:5,10-methylenetetrahydromethanopterin reductase